MKAKRLTHFRNLDLKLALALLSLSVLLTVATFQTRVRYAYLGIIGAAVALAFIFARTKAVVTIDPQITRRFLVASSIGFFASLALSAIFLRSDRGGYTRSVLHFIFLTLMFGIASIQAICAYRTKRYEIAVLAEILIASFWVRIAPQVLFSGVLGIDSWFHLGVVEHIVQQGTIPAGTIYSGLALFHILAASWIEFLGITNLSFLETLGPYLALITCGSVYLLGRLCFNARVGLLGAVCCGFSVYAVSMSSTFVAANLGAALLLLCTFQYLKYLRDRRTARVLTLLILMVALIATHTVMALTLLIVLATVATVNGLVKRLGIGVDSGSRRASTVFPAIFGVCMFAWWSYNSGYLIDLGRVLKWGFQFEPWTPTETSVSYLNQIPQLEYLLNLSGLIGLVVLAVWGTLWLASRTSGLPVSFGPTVAIWTLGAIGMSSIGLQLSGLLGLRWILAFQLLGGLLSALGVVWISSLCRRKASVLVVVFFVVAVASFASLTSPAGNPDTSLYSPNTHVRLAFTDDEIISLSTIATLGAPTNYVISPEYYFFLYYKDVNSSDIGPILISRSFGNASNGLIVLRTSTIGEPIYFTQTLTKLTYNTIETLSLSQSKVYDSGSVVALCECS